MWIYMYLLYCLKIIFNSFATPWTVACQTPLSMGIPGENTGVGYHYLLQGIFPTQGSKPMSPTLAGRFFTTEPPGKYLLQTEKKIPVFSFCCHFRVSTFDIVKVTHVFLIENLLGFEVTFFVEITSDVLVWEC